MSKTRKIVSILLAVLMIMSMLAACGQSAQSSQSASPSAAPSESAAATASTEPSAEATPEGPSWTQDTSPVTLDWYVDWDWYSGKWYPDALVHQEITKRTGVTVNFIVPPGGSSDKLNVMIASGEIPDIITTYANVPQLALLADAGMAASIEELAAQEAPEFLETYPKSMRDWYRYKDGKLYWIPGGIKATETEGSEKTLGTTVGFAARKDIMDQLGIKPEDFNTQDGTIAALKKVADAKTTYNGSPVAPFYAGAEGGYGNTWGWCVTQMFGMEFESKDGHYQDIRLLPKNLEMYKFANRIYREGLWSKDNFTSKVQQIEEKIAAGQVFSFCGSIPDVENSMKTLAKSDPNAIFVSVGPVRASDAGEPTYGVSGTGWTSTVINNNSPKKARTMKFLSFYISNEGQILTHIGIEGVTFTKEGGIDGHYAFTKEYEDAQRADAKAAEMKYGLGQLWVFNNDGFVGQYYPLVQTPEDIMLKTLKDAAIPYFYDNTPLNINLQDGSDEKNLQTQITQFFEQEAVKMLIAESPEAVEKIWNDAGKKMMDMGLQKVIDAQDKAFQENKQKLGVDRVWPTYK